MALDRFYNATEKLVSAFIMGTIKHGKECSCAIGSLCGTDSWTDFHMDRNFFKTKLLFKSVGYSSKEIYFIEQSFEERDNSILQWKLNTTISIDMRLNNDNDPDGFKGLCNVFDYMVSIEDWSSDEKQVNLIEMCLQTN